jgi:integrase
MRGCALKAEWDQIDFTRAHLHVRRLKGGIASVHPIQGDELRALRELRRQTEGAFVFGSERGGPMTRSNVSKMIEAAGERAGLPFAHPKMVAREAAQLGRGTPSSIALLVRRPRTSDYGFCWPERPPA